MSPLFVLLYHIHILFWLYAILWANKLVKNPSTFDKISTKEYLSSTSLQPGAFVPFTPLLPVAYNFPSVVKTYEWLPTVYDFSTFPSRLLSSKIYIGRLFF